MFSSKVSSRFSSKVSSKIMVIYRIITLVLVIMPVAINISTKADIVSSIVYVPLIMLAISAIGIFIDGKLEAVLNRGMVLSKFTLPTVKFKCKNAVFNPGIKFSSV